MPFMPVKIVNIDQSIPTLAEVLDLVSNGDEVVFVAAGKAIARLLPITSELPQRIPGLHEGQGWMSDDFNDPLPDEFWGGRV
jgi:antitoxin (DNA-binding transcriptional repressor) of toxin-antitoxin stability system